MIISGHRAMSGCLEVVSEDAAAGIGNVSNRTRMGN